MYLRHTHVPETPDIDGLLWCNVVQEIVHLIKELLALPHLQTLVSLPHVPHHRNQLGGTSQR